MSIEWDIVLQVLLITTGIILLTEGLWRKKK